MFKMKMPVLLIVTSLLATGCARFQAHQVSEVDLAGRESDRTSSGYMTYTIDKRATYGALGTYEESLESAMRDRGWRLRQSEVPIKDAPHMYVNVSLSKDPAALLPAMLTGFTLYTVPSWETSNYKVTAQVITKSKEREEYFYEVKDKITLVQWLPMVLAFPFAYPFSAEEETLSRMYKNIAMKIDQDMVVK
ncbi:MAG: hypothetical protein ACJATD_000935 [Alloalcanivorax sp.]|jgi:hypothetical protein